MRSFVFNGFDEGRVFFVNWSLVWRRNAFVNFIWSLFDFLFHFIKLGLKINYILEISFTYFFRIQSLILDSNAIRKNWLIFLILIFWIIIWWLSEFFISLFCTIKKCIQIIKNFLLLFLTYLWPITLITHLFFEIWLEFTYSFATCF